MTSHPSRAQHSHPHDESHPVFCNQQDKQVHSCPPSFEDAGYDGQLVAGAGKAGAFYQSGHDLPNGLRINFTIGHIDRLPRCEATGLIVSFCRHCDDLSPFHNNPNSPEAQQ